MTAAGRPTVEVIDLAPEDIAPEDIAQSIAVLARGMRDNPMHIALYGQDSDRRERAITRMFTGFFRMFKAQTPLVAVEGGTIVGVTGVAPPGTCQANFVQQLRAVPTALMLGPRSAAHMVKVVGDWRKRLYQRVGYAVIDEADVIGVHCWFMRRSAHPT